MKTLDQVIKAAQSCDKNGKIYLIDTISDFSGLFCSNGDILYLVINKEGCNSISIETDFLQMDTAVFVQSFDEVRSFPDAEYNILRYKGARIDSHEDNVESFINLCVAHSNLLKGESFEQFFYSMISLFQLPKEQSYLNLMGLFGELIIIQHIFNSISIDISSYWHVDGTFSKYDIALPNHNSIEVKSSPKGNESVTIKHSQIFTVPNKVCLATIQVLEDNSGQTVNELINSMRDATDYCNNLQFELSLQRELKRVSPDEAQNRRFIAGPIKYYLNSSINPFPSLPSNVYGLEYEIDLSDLSELDSEGLSSFLE